MCLPISIHAPRTGSDRSRKSCLLCGSHFNPRSPHGERRAPLTLVWPWEAFQSTLPARGATTRLTMTSRQRSISIHAPRTGSDVGVIGVPCAAAVISIHAPRTGSDGRTGTCCRAPSISIHAPRTGSDMRAINVGLAVGSISIHAPRTGSDPCRSWDILHQTHFNPRSPHGERPPSWSCHRHR